ncbi:hypothetical protein [Lentibacillus sp. CBA3610]|uniref:hypothetical protein n=1 Tax=Lentibacillus sp. CBA3610 TaxID=2518176 RepID=UPI001595172E|nr:hypothetical protein [Lentibacillus sp. CBA3610]QKY68425.1 hypothetical protein Len3610_01225 [Lentibacillus sp. CBA3610]
MKSMFVNKLAKTMASASAAYAESTNFTGSAAGYRTKAKAKMTQKNKKTQNISNDDVTAGMYPESDILDEQVDADSYQMQVVENSHNIRIIILKDESGYAQYKSVFEKDKSMIEVIDFDQGMVFKGVIDV